MTRVQHNLAFDVRRKPDELVRCHTFGYGELSQYDPACPSCWVGASHTWEEHDRHAVAAGRIPEELVLA